MNWLSDFFIAQINLFLKIFVEPVVKMAWQAIKTPINRAFYQLLVLIMRLLDAMQDAVSAFSGARPLRYYGEEVSLLELVFFRSELSVIIWGVTLVGVVLAGYATIAQLRKTVQGVPVGKTLGAAGKSMLTFLLLPLVMVVSLRLTSLVLEGTGRMVGAAGGGEESVTLSGMVFTATTMGAETNKYTETIRNQFVTGQLDYSDTTTVFYYFSAGKMNLLPGVLLAVFFVVIYAIVCLMFVVRCVQLLLLYITAPYYAATIPLDDGRKFRSWRDAYLAKLASGFGLVLSLELFGQVIVPLFASSAVTFSGNELNDFIYRIVFMAGSAFAITRCYTVLIEILNPQMAMQERMVGDAVTDAVKMAAVTAATVATGGAAGVAAAGGGGAAAGGSSAMAQQMMMQAAQSAGQAVKSGRTADDG